MQGKERQLLLLAGLLQGIGRLLAVQGDPLAQRQAAREFVGKRQSQWARFCDADALARYAAEEGEGDFAEWLRTAGSLAGNGERPDGKKHLASVFGRVRLEQEAGGSWVYAPGPLAPDAAFPKQPPGDAPDWTGVERAFSQAAEKLVDTADDFSVLYTGLLRLLQQYAWCVPGGGKGDDVSLYDRLRIQGAIAACGNSGKPPEGFLLIVGDLSGIQRYIFRTISKGAGKLAKRLRARSFYLSLLPEVVSHQLIHRLELPLSSVLMASGGKFYLLAPDSSETRQVVAEIRAAVNQELYGRFHGELALNLAATGFSQEEFLHFGRVMARAALHLNREKSHSFRPLLQSGNGWTETGFVREGGPLAACSVCGKVFVAGEAEYCEECETDEQIGRQLPKAAYVAFHCDGGTYPLVGKYGFTLAGAEAPPGAYLTWKLAESGAAPRGPWWSKNLANHVAVDAESRVRDFAALAADREQYALLACLKADVDRLGTLFLLGLEEQGEVDVCRMATLSRMLDLFFSGRVQQLLKLEEYRDKTYAVYSGGDDLLLIGEWKIICRLALRLEEEFRRYVAGNSEITLSAAIQTFKPHLPVDVAVEMAEEALGAAKETVNWRRTEEKGRNQVSVFDQVMEWKDFRQVLTEGDRCADWQKKGWLASGMLRQLMVFSKMYLQHRRYDQLLQLGKWDEVAKHVADYPESGLLYLPQLKYQIGRNYPPNDREPARNAVREWLDDLADKPHKLLGVVGSVATYALYSNRKGE